MNYANQQVLFDTINKADGKSLWSTCGVISNQLHKAAKAVTKLEKELTYREDNATKEEKEKGSNPPTINVSTLTDAELRMHVKQLLMNRLSAGTLSASDIGQLKDIFGLASKTEELTIQVVDYSNAMLDCPHCNTNLCKPVELSPPCDDVA
jgi:hypothetical protein